MQYTTITTYLMKSKDLTAQQKLLVSLLVVLTKKAKAPTSVSDQFLANEIGKSPAYTSVLLAGLKKLGLVKTYRELGRRMIELDEKLMRQSGFIHTFKAKEKEKGY